MSAGIPADRNAHPSVCEARTSRPLGDTALLKQDRRSEATSSHDSESADNTGRPGRHNDNAPIRAQSKTTSKASSIIDERSEEEILFLRVGNSSLRAIYCDGLGATGGGVVVLRSLVRHSLSVSLRP